MSNMMTITPPMKRFSLFAISDKSYTENISNNSMRMTISNHNTDAKMSFINDIARSMSRHFHNLDFIINMDIIIVERMKASKWKLKHVIKQLENKRSQYFKRHCNITN